MADSTSESSDDDVSSDSDYDDYEGSSDGDYDVSSDDDSDDSNDDNNNDPNYDPRIAAKIVEGDKGRSRDKKWPGVLMLGRLLLLFILIGLVMRVLGCCL